MDYEDLSLSWIPITEQDGPFPEEENIFKSLYNFSHTTPGLKYKNNKHNKNKTNIKRYRNRFNNEHFLMLHNKPSHT